MQIAICDDEKSIGLILEEKMKKLLPDAVIDKYLSGDELIASGCEPDILFLDIQMPGMDGMETARILRQKNERMVLIFVTAVEEYVFQAFDVAAFHYLVKPFSDEKFEKVVKRAVRSIEKYSENQSDELGRKMLDGYIEDFCYCTPYDYRNLFWKICLSLYKKEKRGCGSQYCLYYDYACFIYDSATD